jgi:hypothetical protein
MTSAPAVTWTVKLGRTPTTLKAAGRWQGAAVMTARATLSRMTITALVTMNKRDALFPCKESCNKSVSRVGLS